MFALVPLSPIILTVVLALVLRRSPLEAAIVGTALAVVLWAVGMGRPLTIDTASSIVLDSMVVFASIGFIVVLGVAFVILAERAGVAAALTAWTEALALTDAERIVFVTLGLAVVSESLTGSGVSLVVTIPLLMRSLDRARAIRVSLTSMCIMPWGNLGLPTTMGALLAHADAATVGYLSAVVDGPVFFGIVMSSLLQAGHRTWRSLSSAALLSLLFAVTLALTGAFVGISPASSPAPL